MCKHLLNFESMLLISLSIHYCHQKNNVQVHRALSKEVIVKNNIFKEKNVKYSFK